MEKNERLEKLSNRISALVDRDGEVGYELLESVKELNQIIKDENVSTRELFNYPELVSLYKVKYDDDPSDVDNPVNEFFDSTKFSKEMRQVIEEIKNFINAWI